MPRGRKKAAPKEQSPEKQETVQQTGMKAEIDKGLRDIFLSEHKDDGKIERARRKGLHECACCGRPITDGNAVFQSRAIFPFGAHPICVNCQQRYYAKVAQATNRTYALFYCCVAFNLPYKPSVIEEMAANQNGVWYEYVKKLQQGGSLSGGRTEHGWTDGITDIKDAFGGEFPVLPITGDVLVANMTEMPDRERWNIEWGEGMTDEECRNADDRLMMLTANRSGGTVPGSVNMYLHDAIRYMIARDKASDSTDAKRYQEMADKLMNSDSVKNWQANKGETIQVDKVVRYLEGIGAMENGYLVGYDDLAKILGTQHGNYSTSLDVVDCMIMCIINTMRKNNGDSELTRLPLSAQVTDAKGELMAEMSAEEKKILEGLGMKPPERAR